VHNENEDFYEVLRTKQLPQHDVLVTSPPYSKDHLERCIRYLAKSGKPWCALLPNWVFGKDYYRELLHSASCFEESPPIYVGPAGQSYQYWFPEGASQRPDHINADGKTTPYKTSWFIWLPANRGGSGLLEYLQERRKGADWVVAKTARGLKWLAQKAEARKGGRSAGPATAAKGAGKGSAKGGGKSGGDGNLAKRPADAQKKSKIVRHGGLEVVPSQSPAANALSEAARIFNSGPAGKKKKKWRQQ